MLQSLFFTVFLFVVCFSPGFCWRRLTLSVLLFRLTASSRPGFPYSPFSSNAVSSPNFQVQTSLHSERSARWRCKLYSVDRVTDQRSAQVMNPVNKMASTEDPRKRKIILLLAGIEPGSPSCESDVLPLDHGLPLVFTICFISFQL